MKGSFHAASLSSPRLRKMLDALEANPVTGCTTMTLCQWCDSTRASSDISELRRNGVPIEVTYEGKNQNGRRVYRYKLGEWTKGNL